MDALEQILDQFHFWLEYKKLMVEDCRYETTLIRRSNQHQLYKSITNNVLFRYIAPWVMNLQVKNCSNNNNNGTLVEE